MLGHLVSPAILENGKFGRDQVDGVQEEVFFLKST